MEDWEVVYYARRYARLYHRQATLIDEVGLEGGDEEQNQELRMLLSMLCGIGSHIRRMTFTQEARYNRLCDEHYRKLMGYPPRPVFAGE